MVWLLVFNINFTLQIIQIKWLNVYKRGFEEKNISEFPLANHDQ